MKMVMQCCVLLLLAMTSRVGAAQTQSTEFTCPVDQHRFTLALVLRGDEPAGIDSDFCAHTRGTSVVTSQVIMCPRCNYSAMLHRFKDPVAPETTVKILRTLADSPYRGLENTLAEVPVWERAEMANRCAEVAGLPANSRVEYLLVAVHGLRLQGTRSLDRAYAFPGTIEMERLPGILQDLLERESDPKNQVTLKLHLAMLAQRTGWTGERDHWIQKASQDPRLDDASKQDLKEFVRLTDLEHKFQERLLAMITQSLQDQTLPSDRVNFLRYLEADTLRRVGKTNEALAGYRKVRQPNPGANTLSDLSQHYIRTIEDTADEK